jgi:hypothetical protein
MGVSNMLLVLMFFAEAVVFLTIPVVAVIYLTR